MSKFLKTYLPWLIALAAVVAAFVIPNLDGTINANASNDVNTASVTTVDVTESVDASGYVMTQPYAPLTWKTAGQSSQFRLMLVTVSRSAMSS